MRDGVEVRGGVAVDSGAEAGSADIEDCSLANGGGGGGGGDGKASIDGGGGGGGGSSFLFLDGGGGGGDLALNSCSVFGLASKRVLSSDISLLSATI